MLILFGCSVKHKKSEVDLAPRAYDLPEWAFDDLGIIPDGNEEQDCDLLSDTGLDNE